MIKKSENCCICDRPDTQRCHVKDKSLFNSQNKTHNFFNIIPLCSYCHYTYFDKGMAAIVEARKSFLVLRSLNPLRIEEVPANCTLAINPEYIEWKNKQTHNCLQARLRQEAYRL